MNPSQAQRDLEQAAKDINRALGMTPEQIEKLKGQVVASARKGGRPQRFKDPRGPFIAPRQVEKNPGRNEPCDCGSGKKFKRCCGA